VFFVVHIYMLTIEKGFIEHIKPMLNGFDKVDLSAVEKAYLKADEPGHISK